MRLNWEISSKGQNAVLMPFKPILTRNSQVIAIKLMSDISNIRAAFNGEWVGFEAYVRILIMDGLNATGLTVFMDDYPRDSNPGRHPDVCFRIAKWNGQKAVNNLNHFIGNGQDIINHLPLECSLRFYNKADLNLEKMMANTSEVFKAGIKFDEIDRPELKMKDISFEFCTGLSTYQTSFSPSCFCNFPFENLINEWIKYSISLHTIPDCPPDGGFQISYRESVWETLNRF